MRLFTPHRLKAVLQTYKFMKTSFLNQNKSIVASYFILGIFLLGYAAYISPTDISSLRFSNIGTLNLRTRLIFFIFGNITLLSGGVLLWFAGEKSHNAKNRIFALRVHRITLFLNSFVIITAALSWASIERRIDVVGLMTQSLRLAAPIALGAYSGILSERSGVINIGIEGMMLAASCVGFTVALYAQNIWIGLFAAIIGGAVMAAIHAVLSVRFLVDQIVSGVVINILAVGVTGFIRRGFIQSNPLGSPAVFPIWNIPYLSDIPLIGQILFRHQPMVYAMLILLIFLHVLLFHTVWGLRTRAVGEHPRAADTLGINIFMIRYVNVIAGGMIAGLGGAWFSLETVGDFEDLMTGGKGFIALAAMIFGKWNPVGAFLGALLFGFADAFQIKLQISGVNVPYQFLGMLPYIITMIVLAGVIGRAVAPKADGVPYIRD